MLYWAAVFFVIALIAALFGFGGIAVGAAEIAKVLASDREWIEIVLFQVSPKLAASFLVLTPQKARR